MMDFIMVPVVILIITIGIYKLFELFVCKKERLMILEKMGEGLPANLPELKYGNKLTFSTLKVGSLLVGMGLGLLLGYLICRLTVPGYLDFRIDEWRYREASSLIYGACILLCGGIGLVTAFIVELKLNKK